MKPRTHFVVMLLTTTWLVLWLTACAVVGKPSVVIMSPPSGSQYYEGEDIAVQSAATDSVGVVRIELVVDGNVVRVDPSPTAQGQPNFTLIQTWKATGGVHTILVRAYNAAGAVSDPAGISVSVQQRTAQAPALTPTIPSTPPPGITITPSPVPPTITPSPVPPAPGPSSCTNTAAFVQDVTVPDGTNWAPSQAFNKIWQVRNTGTCTWSGYQLVFASGEAMTTNSTAAVPATAPGATADIIVPMTAPTTPGAHAGQWRLRSSSGLFGPTLSVSIIVTGGGPLPAPAGCTGTASIASFTASANNVAPGTAVTLNWGLVSNADNAEIDQGIGGIETPGSRTVNPTTTTTYTLTARCGGNTKTAQVTINVFVLAPPIAVIYDFIAKANAAGDTWQSSGGYGSFNLPFPGSDVDTHGFALWRDNFKLNDGSQPSRVLETHPQWTASGAISRCYHDLWNSGYKVQASDHISGKVGFLQNASAGDVTFRVRLRTDSFPNYDVAVIHLIYADGVKSFNVPLGTINSGQYVGHQADICLIVEAGSSASQDWAVWQDVRIIR